MCGVKLQDRVPSEGLRDRLGLDDIILGLQENRLRWYGHVLRKEVNDWVKKYMEYEVEGARPRGSIMEIGEAIKNPAYRIFQTEYSGCLDISTHA